MAIVDTLNAPVQQDAYRGVKPKVYRRALEGPIVELGAIENLLADYRVARDLLKRTLAWEDGMAAGNDVASWDLQIVPDIRAFLGGEQ